MIEARIFYENGRKHTVEANNLETLKAKCKPFIEEYCVGRRIKWL